MIALIDTHILVWWFERSKRLSAAQRRVLAKANSDRPLAVADVTLWEVALLVEAGRLRLSIPVDAWLATATAAPLVERLGMSPAIAREMISLTPTRGWDLADRVLVATARVLNLPLVTSDTRIIDAGLVTTIE